VAYVRDRVREKRERRALAAEEVDDALS